MAEKTIEELQAELESIKKANLEKEIAAEKIKEAEAEHLKAQKEADELKNKLRDEVRAELVKEMGDESKVEKPEGSSKETFTGNVAAVRLKYSKVPLQMVPGNMETLAVYKDDLTALSSVVEQQTGKKMTGKTYEDLVLEMEQKRLLRGA